jgi:hypothetical protein
MDWILIGVAWDWKSCLYSRMDWVDTWIVGLIRTGIGAWVVAWLTRWVGTWITRRIRNWIGTWVATWSTKRIRTGAGMRMARHIRTLIGTQVATWSTWLIWTGIETWIDIRIQTEAELGFAIIIGTFPVSIALHACSFSRRLQKQTQSYFSWCDFNNMMKTNTHDVM